MGDDVLAKKLKKVEQARVVWEYTVPPQLAETTGIKTVSIVELTAGEELQATKRARGDVTRLAFELTKQSLYQIDGKHVGTGDSTVDDAWDRLGPKLRQLVMNAYGDVHNPGDGESALFLESRREKA